MAIDFVLLFVTYRVAARIAPDVLGEVAERPAAFAAWVAVVRLPMTLAYLVAASGRPLWTIMKTGEFPDRPERQGWRQFLTSVRDQGAELVATALAALIVFDRVADPGVDPVWPLVVVTVAGPWLLPMPVTVLIWLLRRWWRNQPDLRPRHAAPDDDQPDQVGVSPETTSRGIRPDRPEQVGFGETPDAPEGN
ncbi:hypothetical protein [Micromonospora sp. U56]|uniref:hypothetical protein n=1 Tax=Micromonospora sp. U56 TaxID=2824900 RepID=UPI001B39B172|nr:hypothetical protein [Micromonospora sp. U56]